MAKFSLCIEPVFPELDFYDRITAAADLGFNAIEFWDPAGRDTTRIGRLAAQNHLSVATCCLKDAWSNRLNQPTEKVLANYIESARIAKDMGCQSLIALAGDEASKHPAEGVESQDCDQKEILVDNLKRLAETADREGVTVNVEALNSLVDHKGYYLDSAQTGFEIIKRVGCRHIKLLYDVYHMQIMEGNLIQTITGSIEWIGHFHSAGVPGRHELFTGEIHYPAVVKAIDAAGYPGFFGLEYWPSYDHHQSLKDVMAYLK
jgi:hydroxypyruvate isomerase